MCQRVVTTRTAFNLLSSPPHLLAPQVQHDAETDANVSYVGSFTGLNAAVNIVRFSPLGAWTV